MTAAVIVRYRASSKREAMRCRRCTVAAWSRADSSQSGEWSRSGFFMVWL